MDQSDEGRGREKHWVSGALVLLLVAGPCIFLSDPVADAASNWVVVELRLHDGVKLEVLRRHGIQNRRRKVCRDVLLEPRIVLRLALPNLTHVEPVGSRVRDVDDEAGLLLRRHARAHGGWDPASSLSLIHI